MAYLGKRPPSPNSPFAHEQVIFGKKPTPSSSDSSKAQDRKPASETGKKAEK